MIGTGNFHAKNARLYEDFGFFTTNPEIGDEVANLFNTLTGYGHPEPQRKTLVAPDLDAPAAHQRDRPHDRGPPGGRETQIIMKMNALVDQKIIEALYRASRAGVPISLNVRGICCLSRGSPGVGDDRRDRRSSAGSSSTAGSTPSTAATSTSTTSGPPT